MADYGLMADVWAVQLTPCTLLAEIEVSSGGVWKFISKEPVGRAIVGAILCTLSLWFLLPNLNRQRKVLGAMLGIGGLGLFWSLVPLTGNIPFQTAFWMFASIAIVASVATISSKVPLYSAIWFAVSLLGIAGLFVLQGAQFLGVATVAVYAGAIVVTFLFVLMLAQPEGQAYFDQVSWGKSPRLIVPTLSAFTIALLVVSFAQVDEHERLMRMKIDEHLAKIAGENETLELRSVRLINGLDGQTLEVNVWASTADSRRRLEESPVVRAGELASIEGYENAAIRFQFDDQVAAEQHVAQLGSNLFSRHLVAVEVAGCLLMVALVGAIAIASHGNQSPAAKVDVRT